MTAQAMMERFELPEELALRLPLLADLLNGRDQVLANGFSYERLLLEMSQAITSAGMQSSVPQAQSSGQFWIHPEAIINEEVTIEGPCIVCRGAEVGPEAFLGPGTVVGPFAKLGYGVVVKASIIGAKSKIKFRTSIANSIVGESANISETVAVATPPNQRSPIRSWNSSGQPLETDLSALGSQIGNQADIGEGSLILPGSVVCDDVKVRNSTIDGYINSLDIPPKASPNGETSGEVPWLPSFFPDEQRKGPAVISNKVLLTAVVVSAVLMAGLLGLAFYSMSRVETSPMPDYRAAEPTDSPGPVLEAGQVPDEPPVGKASDEASPQSEPLSGQEASLLEAVTEESSVGLSPTPPEQTAGQAAIGAPPSTQQLSERQPTAEPTAPSPPEPQPNQDTAGGLIPLSTPGYTLQVGSFRTRGRAQIIEELLKDRGYSPYVVEAQIPGVGRYYRVRVGRLASPEEAQTFAREISNRLGRELGATPWMVPYGPGQ